MCFPLYTWSCQTPHTEPHTFHPNSFPLNKKISNGSSEHLTPPPTSYHCNMGLLSQFYLRFNVISKPQFRAELFKISLLNANLGCLVLHAFKSRLLLVVSSKILLISYFFLWLHLEWKLLEQFEFTASHQCLHHVKHSLLGPEQLLI